MQFNDYWLPVFGKRQELNIAICGTRLHLRIFASSGVAYFTPLATQIQRGFPVDIVRNTNLLTHFWVAYRGIPTLK